MEVKIETGAHQKDAAFCLSELPYFTFTVKLQKWFETSRRRYR